MRPILPLLATGIVSTPLLIEQPAFAEDAPAGSYECWYFSTPSLYRISP
jgi:hypothetical protein